MPSRWQFKEPKFIQSLALSGRPPDDRMHLQLHQPARLHPRGLLRPERDVLGLPALLPGLNPGPLHLEALLQAHPTGLGHQRLASDPHHPKLRASNP